MSTTLPVGGASPYDVVIGRGLAAQLPQILGDKVQRVALLYAGELGDQAETVAQALQDHYDVHAFGLPSGERTKTYDIVVQCWEALGELGFTRSDAVVTFGGGATTDMGGFVAATWLRGVRVVHIPTTLLAMVDAAVGGKTGINTGAGKNLVGAFHEPAGVLVDLDTLATLPREEFLAGLGEVVKCGFIADPEILDLIESTDAEAITADAPITEELIRRAIQVKIDVVVADLKETGGTDGHPGREALNYGHTLAHAIEKHTEYAIRHGEAVAIGCIYAAELARLAGRLDAETAARHARVFAKAGLPTGFGGASFDDLIGAMRVDKKARGSQLRFLVLDGLAQPSILAGPEESMLREAFEVVAR
ncbi:3-dehydroquinate synthase [Nocardioides sp.]|uniref:3-dehydroquinate synthase n=1 Tax=Nocardioides sp. TaxID=35761 RepID=UPI002625F0A2|nr:3-dehydroquinate synthase [Nocardioides sp.]